MGRFNLRKLNEAEGNEEYWIEMPNRDAASENLDDDVGTKRAWETVRGNIKISAIDSLGYYKFKQDKPWLCKGCSKL
jgi:hypothetical protein